MASWQKKGADGNVDSGSGSKGSKGSGAARGPSVSATDGGSGRSGGGAGASSTEKTHNVDFAEGGTTKMFGEQEAAEKKPGITGKVDGSGGPGEKFASGGTTKM